jgi:putative SOS response-associated peptidase YedK
MAFMRWGLVPHWTETAKPTPLINARSETTATSPAFRDPFHRRRCLVPASGFYAWAKVGSRKHPYHFHRPGGQPLAFAALDDR